MFNEDSIMTYEDFNSFLAGYDNLVYHSQKHSMLYDSRPLLQIVCQKGGIFYFT